VHKGRYSLTSSIYRSLAIRLVLACTAISLLFGGISYVRSYGDIGDDVMQHARNEIDWLRYRIRALMSEDGLPLQEAAERVLAEDPQHELDRRHGQFVFARLAAEAGELSAVWADEEASRDDELLGAFRSREQVPIGEELTPRPFDLAGRVFLELQIPIQGQQSASGYVYAIFQLSEQALQRVQRDLLTTIAYVVLIVFATAVVLFPIIVMLVRRVSRFSEDLLDSNLETLQVLGGAIAKKDSDTDAHNYRVTLYSVRLAEAIDLDADDIRSLIKGAFLHDVGKIGIRDEILLKPGRLDADEFAVMKTHVDHGLEIVGKSRWLKDAVSVVGSHHEKFDGNGYPTGSRGESIPITARIFAIADVFDALASKRPYKEPLTFKETMQILEQGRGKHFDPGLLDEFAMIAPRLHETLCGRDDPALRADLEDVVSRYFKGQPA
jgi:HD-GYP domain-containing protein (c-di-GMP phosphodiesterase class II)